MSPLGGGRRGLRSRLFGILSTVAHADSARISPNASIARKQFTSLSPLPRYATKLRSSHDEPDSDPLPPETPLHRARQEPELPSRTKGSAGRQKLEETSHHGQKGQPQRQRTDIPERSQTPTPRLNAQAKPSRSVTPPISAPLRYIKGYNLSQPKRRQLREKIESECMGIQSSPDHAVNPSEYLVREMSLYPISHVHPSWKKNLKALYDHKRRNVPVPETWELLSTEDSEVVRRWIKSILGSPRTDLPPSARWRRLCRTEAARRWPIMVLWLLLHSPMQALRFLEATTTRFSPSFPMVSDCFVYLEKFHAAEFQDSSKLKSRYIRALQHCLRPEVLPYLSKDSQTGFRLYLKHCERHSLMKCFNYVLRNQKFLSLETLFYFTDLFTKSGNIREALNSLRLLITRFESQNHVRYQKISDRCCNLLKLDRYKRQDDGTISFDILPQILQMGVQPDLFIFNIVVSNALKADDLDTALQIVQLMENQGVTPDSYTHLSILHHAVRLRDHEKVDHILSKIAKVDTLSAQPHLVSKTLHAMLLFPHNTSPGQKGPLESFQKMLDFYKKTHQIQPLVDLGLVPRSQNDELLSASKSPPSSHVLNIMITAHLRTRPHSDKIWRYFTRFQALVASGHPLITPLASTDYIFNSFLMALRFEPQTIYRCFKILNYMLQPLSELAVQTIQAQNSGPASPRPAQPSKRTWTILLNTLISHNQMQAAEKLHQTMKERGVEINDVAWNILIRGYACNQMVEAAANALKEMERQSWSPDGHTVKALGFIENQELLRTLLDRLDAGESELEKSDQNTQGVRDVDV
ncbi:pentatricopeptide repeat protein [Nannizzia gypsea CBS 118893]|uniref:Pentatricopeptide repeat protein n=1 Tax=Arthroderma gypseum (strain ATCC MYA-4604 / CBS 118893) TaxID=535722 RepID=E4V6K9_ARTGP|nr:pentatricopeptide repeat protein [Nannizzia gypsea CBS 118893]EFQ96725.1 pentatricopeptide repeat protein [Nannizzia gypsea CBS 118893]